MGRWEKSGKEGLIVFKKKKKLQFKTLISRDLKMRVKFLNDKGIINSSIVECGVEKIENHVLSLKKKMQ